jgi:DNA-binding transcriptional regulator YbjK
VADNGTSPDRSGAVVTAAMVLLALLGVATVFHDPIATLLAPPPAATEPPPTGK